MLRILQFFRRPIAFIIRKKAISRLFLLTGEAFCCPAPDLKKLSGKMCLEKYALFTAEQAMKIIQSGRDIGETKMKLYQNALLCGREIRRHLHIKTVKDMIAASRIIYAVLGIEMDVKNDEIIIRKCYFSSYYDFCVCHILSSLDEGMAQGISDGYRLEFSQAITQGFDTCKAHLRYTGTEK
jgi:hypothetical protein